MKYFKFAQISAETGISWAISQPTSGPSWPDISGLNLNTSIQLAHSPIYYIAQVNDSAVPDPDNHIFELTQEQYATELESHVMYQLNKEKDSIYNQEYDFRSSIFSKYHDTASIAGIYKYEQAKELLNNPLALAPDVRAEATTRGLDVITMANRIVTNHEDFRNKEAKIAGIRGKLMDRLNSYIFDLNNPDISLIEYVSQEIIGTRTEIIFENDVIVEKKVDVIVGKYTLSLPTRFQYE